jgi:AraC-like DNA-binding protein
MRPQLALNGEEQVGDYASGGLPDRGVADNHLREGGELLSWPAVKARPVRAGAVAATRRRSEMRSAVDTASVAPDDRFTMWHEAARRCFFPLDLKQLGPRPFSGRLIHHDLVAIDVFQIIADASLCRRTAAGIAEADPEQLKLHLLRKGRCGVEQDGRCGVLTPGTITLLDTSARYTLEAREPFELVIFTVPRTLLGPYADTLRRTTATVSDTRAGVASLLASFLDGLMAQLEDGSTARYEGPLAETVLALLRALALESAGEDFVAPAPLLHDLKDYIERYLADPALSPATIAAAHFISTRYLHKLFSLEEHSVSETIRRARLERCRRDLTDPALAGETIASIAMRSGMRDAAHFSRLFRDAYGCSPREHRASGLMFARSR